MGVAAGAPVARAGACDAWIDGIRPALHGHGGAQVDDPAAQVRDRVDSAAMEAVGEQSRTTSDEIRSLGQSLAEARQAQQPHYRMLHLPDGSEAELTYRRLDPRTVRLPGPLVDEVVVHPQSIIHSMVQFEDGSIKAQLGLPDMRIPIQFALSYPDRYRSDFPRFNFADYPELTFEKPDLETFRNLGFAFEALEKGGNMPCILNAANEVAVAEFLKEKIGFLQIPDVIEKCMAKLPYISTPDFEDYICTDKDTRIIAKEIIN